MISVVPSKLEPAVYADTSMTIPSQHDITLVFMRAPYLTPEVREELDAEGNDQLTGQVVSSVTIPREVALEMATNLVRFLNGDGK